MRFLATVLLLVSTVAALAQEASFGTQIHVTAIELSAEVLDASGNTPRDLQPSDFVIVEEGVEYPVTAIDYSDLPETHTAATPAQAASTEPKRDWRTLIYVDLELSSRATIRDALASLSAQAERLTSLGTVDLVVANPAARQVVSTSDPAALVAAFKELARSTPQDRISQLRRDYLDDDRSRDAINKVRGTMPRQLGLPSEYMHATDVLAKTRTFVEQEQGLIGNLYTRVLRWTSRYPRKFPSALMFVSDGFALDPVAFSASG